MKKISLVSIGIKIIIAVLILIFLAAFVFLAIYEGLTSSNVLFYILLLLAISIMILSIILSFKSRILINYNEKYFVVNKKKINFCNIKDVIVSETLVNKRIKRAIIIQKNGIEVEFMYICIGNRRQTKKIISISNELKLLNIT